MWMHCEVYFKPVLWLMLLLFDSDDFKLTPDEFMYM